MKYGANATTLTRGYETKKPENIMQVLINVADTLPQAFIQQQIQEFEESLKKQAQKSKKQPNETTKAAMLDVRAKKNLQNITLEQLQQDFSMQ